jgi:type 1 glutamine amidotransferase
MCVLGRPFSIRQLSYQGMNVALMRDLTDTMYNPRMAPYVSHFTGTDLVIEHIERHWCPTITSADVLGGTPYRFDDDQRPHAIIVMAEDEYETDETLPAFAPSHLGRDFKLSYVFANEEDRNDLPGIEVLADADLAILSVRRRVLPQGQMAVIRQFIAQGKPLVALRTASHAFELRDADVPEGYADWQGFDKEVLGCDYVGHHPSNTETGPKTYVWRADGAEGHPIVAGLSAGELEVPSTLYQSLPLGPRTTLLMMGRYGDVEPREPVAWTNTRDDGGRVFYTSLGHRGDFELPAFRRLLQNGIYWAAGLPVPDALAQGQ